MSCCGSNSTVEKMATTSAPSFTKSLTWRRAAKAFGKDGPAPDLAPLLDAIVMCVRRPPSFALRSMDQFFGPQDWGPMEDSS